MKKAPTTTYLAIFLLVCLVLDGILLCGFSEKAWWNNWMAMIPNIYMILGAFYCQMMKKNVETPTSKLNWLFIYKGIKFLVSIVAVVLFIIFIKHSIKPFIIITAISYLVALTIETCVYTHYIKNLNKESKHE